MFDVNKIEELYPQAGDLMWEPMLMWKLPDNKKTMFEDVCSNGQYFASIKKDGACYQFVKTQDHSYLFGRTISKTTGLLTEKIANVPHIKQALDNLPARTVIVFEIYYPGKSSRNTTTVMGCLPELAIKRQENNPIHAYAHDILYYDDVDLRQVGALDRYKILAAIWEKHNLSAFNFMELAQPIYDDIFKACADALANGEEGLVLRKKTAPWTIGKRPAWDTIKMKKMDTADLVCVGFEDATMEYTGKLDLGKNYSGGEADQWPYWCIFRKDPFDDAENLLVLYEKVPIGTTKVIKGIEFVTLPVTKGFYYGWKTRIKVGAYDDNGNLVEVGSVSSGLTDKNREYMAIHPEEYLGHVFCFEMMEKDNSAHTLRHGHFIGPRPDKDAKDCKISEIFI